MGEGESTNPTSCGARVVEEDEDEGCPDRGKEGDQTDNESQHQRRLHDVAQGFCAQEAGEGVALHSLENVVLGGVEDFRVVAVLVLDGVCDLLEDAEGDDDLALGALEQVGVKDLLGRGADVLPRDGGALRGMGRQHVGAAVNIISYYCLALPLGIWLAFHGWGLEGLWVGQCIALYIVGALEWVIVGLSDWDYQVKKAAQAA